MGNTKQKIDYRAAWRRLRDYFTEVDAVNRMLSADSCIERVSLVALMDNIAQDCVIADHGGKRKC